MRVVARLVASSIFAGLALAAWPRPAQSQQSFRTSLTATVSRLESVEAGSRHSARADALRCRRVTLHWTALPRAERYAVYVSATGRDGWRPLAPRNACGRGRVLDPTTVVDVEPTAGGATVVRHLYYKIVAFDRADGAAHAMATTLVVPVELP